MASKPVCRGRGLGRGWLQVFQPNPCPVNVEGIENVDGKYEDSDLEESNSSTSIDELSDQIADDIIARRSSSGDTAQNDTISTPQQCKNEEKPENVLSSELQEETNKCDEQRKSLLLKAVHAKEFVPKSALSVSVPGSVEDINGTNTNVKYKQLQNTSVVILKKEHVEEYLPKALVPDEQENKSVTSEEYPSVSKMNLNDEQLPNTSVLLSKVVNVKEFVPKTFTPMMEERNSITSAAEDQVVLGVLEDTIYTLMEDPGDFDNVVDHLTEHLKNFVTKEETLNKVVTTLIDQAISEPNFRYTAAKLCQHFNISKTLELENGVTFRKIFFQRCQGHFYDVSALVNNDDIYTDENIWRITSTAMLFGELFCNMKLKEKPIPVYMNAIISLVKLFLKNGNEKLVVSLTKLLKLVGPEMDTDSPKESEALFNDVKDFYLDKTKSGHLSGDVKKNIWHVYKLHSRDWDRKTSAPTSPAIACTVPLQFVMPDEKPQSSDSRRSPVDWNDYYVGNDDELEFYTEGYEDDEECEAYEEFLRSSGQL
ncbi:polyadenylate-binding protein-interacting protein 1-like [Hydractinia symbiolongicarpus]|uniref:polyadenylate-binding protein-interacting protein 1-like n=1 Tax=Hydractinia symbiolongicarpus TaxID=13093 RepID=UPI00254ACF02|nr:polyadenylate-binding protein-interacting protein 1-like [Hydractinia symbiolongicarpus]XP_057299623.1 polyadenylate-binding protein-interacting protein 1-like [Hydractinia symbiolongicarpus]